MGSDRIELRPTIDRAWLEREAEKDPVTHAYALWDLDRFPDRVRFVSACRGESTVAYVLIWQPPDRPPMAIWVGPAIEALAPALPPRPLIVTGSDAVRPLVERDRAPAVVYPILVEIARRGTRPPLTAHDAQVRRLTPRDVPRLAGIAEGSTDVIATSYAALDLDTEVAFGGFDGEELVAVARAVVRLPTVWLVSGVFVRPSRRGQGWGQAITRAVQLEAERARAPCALFVREDNVPAVTAYERLGFRPVDRRFWLDCGVHLSP
ncbi:MAG TPA: GNAT family N-acetyltransferase [Thermoplasmata archaeon]|nr:GNAT family N-acetyltransferase [Thermoplasmata archaeon]